MRHSDSDESLENLFDDVTEKPFRVTGRARLRYLLVVARIRDSSNPDSNLNANFAGEREDSNP
jgi:hypothetical protein